MTSGIYMKSKAFLSRDWLEYILTLNCVAVNCWAFKLEEVDTRTMNIADNTENNQVFFFDELYMVLVNVEGETSVKNDIYRALVIEEYINLGFKDL